MKLIQKFYETNDAEMLVSLLKKNGIPAKIHVNKARFIGADIQQYKEVWLYIDAQYIEAINLLNDKNYKVKNPVDLKLFNKYARSAEAKKHLSKLTNSFIKKGLILIIILLAIGWYINEKI